MPPHHVRRGDFFTLYSPYRRDSSSSLDLNTGLTPLTATGSAATGAKIGWIQVAAIDPAIYNCAVRVERRFFNLETLEQIGNPKTIVQVKFDFGKSNPINSMMQIFDERLDAYLKWCKYILVESQLSVNPSMIKMSYAIIGYISKMVSSSPINAIVVEVAARFKTRDAPPGLDKPSIKRWAFSKALEIIRDNEDAECLTLLEGLKKRDDHSDVICYIHELFLFLKERGNV